MPDRPLIALTILGIVAVVPSAYAVRTALAGRASDPRVTREGGTALLSLWLMEAFHWWIRGVGRLLVRSGLSPDTFTITSLLVTSASVPLAATGRFAPAGLAVLLGGAFDSFDGMVARARRMSSDSGEVLDAIVDRYADMAPLLALAVHYRGSAWQMSVPLVALVGSTMVSYARAKAESMSIQLAPGLMRRHERIAYLSGGLMIGPVIGAELGEKWGVDQPATLLIVAFVGVLSNVAAFRLVRETRARLVAEGRGPGATT